MTDGGTGLGPATGDDTETIRTVTDTDGGRGVVSADIAMTGGITAGSDAPMMTARRLVNEIDTEADEADHHMIDTREGETRALRTLKAFFPLNSLLFRRNHHRYRNPAKRRAHLIDLCLSVTRCSPRESLLLS